MNLSRHIIVILIFEMTTIQKLNELCCSLTVSTNIVHSKTILQNIVKIGWSVSPYHTHNKRKLFYVISKSEDIACFARSHPIVVLQFGMPWCTLSVQIDLIRNTTKWPSDTRTALTGSLGGRISSRTLNWPINTSHPSLDLRTFGTSVAVECRHDFNWLFRSFYIIRVRVRRRFMCFSLLWVCESD